MKLIVVRHGETVENTKHIMMGHMHGTLSGNGREQARAVAQKLRKQRIDAIFSSDLGRARATVRQIARYHKVPVVYTKALREQNYGIFQGRPLSELIEAQESGAARGGVAFKIPGGESRLDMMRRVRKFVKGLEVRYEGKTVLVLGHAGTVWSLISIYRHIPLGKAIKKMKPRNTGVLIMSISNGKARVIRDDMFA